MNILRHTMYGLAFLGCAVWVTSEGVQAGTVDYKHSKYHKVRQAKQAHGKQYGKSYARHVHSHQRHVHAHPYQRGHRHHRRNYRQHPQRHGYYYPGHTYGQRRATRHRRNVRPHRHFHRGVNAPCFNRLHTQGISWGVNFNGPSWGAGVYFD